jgi:ketosteroid isomerase-like protein
MREQFSHTLENVKLLERDWIQMADVEEQIRDRFKEATEAWNRGDLNTYLAGYWDSEETRWISGGMIIRGVEAIRARYKSLYDSPEKLGKLEVKDLEIDILTDSNALLVGKWSHTAGQLTRVGVFTIHMKKIQGEWVIATDHASESEYMG